MAKLRMTPRRLMARIEKTALHTDTKLKPAVFMHIQKTAGTSIVDLAWQNYGYSTISHGDYVNHQPEDFQHIQFVSGHFGYEFASYFMPDRFSFTFLRDPVERVLSFYYFCRTRNPDELPIYRKAHELSLNEFLQAGFEDPLIQDRIWNGQVWRLARGCPNKENKRVSDYHPETLLEQAISHLEHFSHIGFVDTFDQDLPIVLEALGIEAPAGESRSNANPQRPKTADLSERDMALIVELTSLDHTMYEVARSRHGDKPSDTTSSGMPFRG